MDVLQASGKKETTVPHAPDSIPPAAAAMLAEVRSKAGVPVRPPVKKRPSASLTDDQIMHMLPEFFQRREAEKKQKSWTRISPDGAPGAQIGRDACLVVGTSTFVACGLLSPACQCQLTGAGYASTSASGLCGS